MKTSPALLALAVFAVPVSAGNFTGLGLGPGYVSTRALDISGDGSAVIGEGRFVAGGTPSSWRWAGDGVQTIPALPGYTGSSLPGGISRDGTVITGNMSTPSSSSTVGYRWTTGAISELEGGSVNGGLVAVSGDGVTALGASMPDYTSFRSTVAGGRLPLGPLQGTPFGAGGFNVAVAATHDGGVIAGWAYARVSVSQPNSLPTPYRWTAATGMQAVLNNGQLMFGSASDMTPDGRAMVGNVSDNASRLFLWTTTGGYQFIDLLTVPNAAPRTAADGLTVIAGSNYWTPSTGVQSIGSVLTAAGCHFPGWTLGAATGISDDGRTLCGWGVNPLGQTEGWIATIPSPAAGTTLALGLIAMGRRRAVHHHSPRR